MTVRDPWREILAAAISRTPCGSSRVAATTAAFAAAVPQRGPGSGEPAHHRGAASLHCQEPMAPADRDPGIAHTVFFTPSGPTEYLAVCLRTRVLRCRCGFRMEIPHH